MVAAVGYKIPGVVERVAELVQVVREVQYVTMT